MSFAVPNRDAKQEMMGIFVGRDCRRSANGAKGESSKNEGKEDQQHERSLAIPVRQSAGIGFGVVQAGAVI